MEPWSLIEFYGERERERERERFAKNAKVRNEEIR